MLRFITTISFLFILSFLFYAQNNDGFEGTIKIKRQTTKDTSLLVFFIKKENIRVDEYDNKMQLKKFALINLSNSEILVFKPNKKIYTSAPIFKQNKNIDSSIIILKTQNYQYLLGKKCYQWRLKVPKQNTEFTYWVSDENYPVFHQIMNLFNNFDKAGTYYYMIAGAKKVFPILIVERSLLREWKLRTEVVEVKKETVDSTVFVAPDNYKLFE